MKDTEVFSWFKDYGAILSGSIFLITMFLGGILTFINANVAFLVFILGMLIFGVSGVFTGIAKEHR